MERVFNLLEETNTNWTVKKLPLVAIETTDEGVKEHKTDSFGMFRSDNGGNLGTVGNRYAVTQNHELAETMIGLQDRFGGDLRGSEFKGGKKIFYQLSRPERTIGPDTVKRNITILSSHDGSSSIGFGSTNTVISCDNMFHQVMKDLQSFRHTQSSKSRLEMAIQNFQLATKNESQLMDVYERFANTPLTKNGLIEAVVEGIFNLPEDEQLISTQKKNKVLEFKKEALDREISQKGSTLWGLFNSVTYYTNHVEKDRDINHLMSGGGYHKNQKAFEIISNAIKVPVLV
tara:strand:- start:1036 stop:1899 length:864 start_codon:yes stop_codon:yes gene_type:complete